MHCVYCGNQNPDGSAVCQNCGRTLPPQQGTPSWGNAPSYPPPATLPTDPAGGAPSSGGWAPPQSPAPWAPSSYPPPADPGFSGNEFRQRPATEFREPAAVIRGAGTASEFRRSAVRAATAGVGAGAR
ncbi:MAG: hypothetical protein IPF53_21460 [Blastocatellia bacterium]|nr:hypothetical protein [Blastocatellia bacterium]